MQIGILDASGDVHGGARARATFVEAALEQGYATGEPLREAVLLALGLPSQIAQRPLVPALGDRELARLQLEVRQQQRAARRALGYLHRFEPCHRALERRDRSLGRAGAKSCVAPRLPVRRLEHGFVAHGLECFERALPLPVGGQATRLERLARGARAGRRRARTVVEAVTAARMGLNGLIHATVTQR